MLSWEARNGAPLLWHLALPGSRSDRGWDCLESHGVSLVRHVVSDLNLVRGCKPCLSKVRKIMAALHGTNWALDMEYGAYPPHKSVRAWPKMDGPLGSVRIFTLLMSLIATDSQIRSSLAGLGKWICLGIPLRPSCHAGMCEPPNYRMSSTYGWMALRWTMGRKDVAWQLGGSPT